MNPLMNPLMNPKITVISKSQELRKNWKHDFETASQQIKVSMTSPEQNHSDAEIVLLDYDNAGMVKFLQDFTRIRRVLFLVVDESQSTHFLASLNPELRVLINSKVDDFIVTPFRSLELQSKMRYAQEILRWEEVSKINLTFREILQKLSNDLSFIESLQQNFVSSRFSDLKDVKVVSRYFSGLRPGGDFFDIAESRDLKHLSLILSDSSSYGLSRALLSILMKVALRLGQDSNLECSQWVESIAEELMVVLRDSEQLSLFYGVLTRKDYKVNYVNLGSSRAFFALPRKNFEILETHSQSIKKGEGLTFLRNLKKSEIHLKPESRLVLLSDGFTEALGGDTSALEFLNRFRTQESYKIVNEISFLIKSSLSKAQEDLPSQDCSAIVLDMNLKAIAI